MVYYNKNMKHDPGHKVVAFVYCTSPAFVINMHPMCIKGGRIHLDRQIADWRALDDAEYC